MDTFFEKTSDCLEKEDLHCVGLTCLFMASKYVEKLPLKLQEIYEDVTKGKIAKEEVRKTEVRILKAL